jgi:hypothetical protein
MPFIRLNLTYKGHMTKMSCLDTLSRHQCLGGRILTSHRHTGWGWSNAQGAAIAMTFTDWSFGQASAQLNKRW